MRVLDVGSRALLVEVADAVAAAGLAGWVRRSGLAVTEVVPAARTVLLDGLVDVPAARALLQHAPGTDGLEAGGVGPLVEVPVVYDGPDLEDVARRWGTDVPGVVERHTGLALVSAFCGFAPGFAYLAGLPPALEVPRLDSPRARVPAGVGGGRGHLVRVYPSASPGGWRLLGRTDAVLWDVDRPSPALLSPGTRVRFVAVQP